MTDNNSPVTEDELHAYVDGELPADRTRGRRQLARRASRARPRPVAAWRAQAEAIRARYGATVDEPVPARLKLDQMMRQERPARPFVRRGGGGRASLAFLIGGGAGWIARGASPPPPSSFDTAHRRRAARPTSSTWSRCAIRSKCRAASART